MRIRRYINNFLNSKLFFDKIVRQKTSHKKNMYFVFLHPKRISQISLLPEASPKLIGPNAVYGAYTGIFDKLTTPFSRDFMYITVKSILSGKKWESTPYYKKLIKSSNENDATKNFEKINKLINSLSINGYLTQFELNKTSITNSIGPFEVPRNEIIIGMDRKGRFIKLVGGRHRLAIAQHLDIKEIPAILTLFHDDAIDSLPQKKRIVNGSLADFRPFD